MNRTWVRLTLLTMFLVAVYAVGRATGFTEQLTVEGIRESMRAAGIGGFFVFLVTFSVGQLLYIPGFVFVAVAGLAYGPVWGSVASIIAATISVGVSFVIVRTIGGQPLKEINKPFLKKWLDRLEAATPSVDDRDPLVLVGDTAGELHPRHVRRQVPRLHDRSGDRNDPAVHRHFSAFRSGRRTALATVASHPPGLVVVHVHVLAVSS